MPIYTVHCTNLECQHDEEVIVPYTEKDLQVCPKCQSRMTAIPSAPGCFLWSGDKTFSSSGGKNCD